MTKFDEKNRDNFTFEKRILRGILSWRNHRGSSRNRAEGVGGVEAVLAWSWGVRYLTEDSAPTPRDTTGSRRRVFEELGDVKRVTIRRRARDGRSDGSGG